MSEVNCNTYDFLVQMKNMTDASFSMLREQKLELLKLIEDGKATDQMNGLVHLIDHIQDSAVDIHDVPEGVVFPEQPETVSTICKCAGCQG